MTILMKCWGGLFSYGFVRGLRGDGYRDNMLSTRFISSFGNGLFYGCCVVVPLMRLSDRIQICLEGKDPAKYPDAYREFMGYNLNIIL